MSSSTSYPWFFFYRTARLVVVIFLPGLFITLFFYQSFYREGFNELLKEESKQNLLILKNTLTSIQQNKKDLCQIFSQGHETKYAILKNDGSTICNEFNVKEEQFFRKIITKSSPGKDYFYFEKEKSDSSGASLFFAILISKQGHVFIKAFPGSTFKHQLDQFDQFIFKRVIPSIFLSYLIFMFLFYKSTTPLSGILSKLQKFKDEIPLKKNLELFYKKDEWSSLEAALNEADLKIQEQMLKVQNENEKNTAILESINDDIIAIDRFETILFHNTKFENNFMRRREGSEINKKIWHIFDHKVLDAFRFVLSTGDTQALKSMSFPDSHHPNKVFDLTITPLKLKNGTIHGALGVFYDVTEFKLAEKMRVDFVANVSHEIRTPLTSIKGFSQILLTQTGKVDKDLHPFLNKIVSNTERMISLFNDLLNLSVIESRDHLRSEDISLQGVIEIVEGNIKANYPEKDVTFEYDLKIQAIKGDTRLIEQAVLNLCDNACKYSLEKVHIKISSFEKTGKCCLMVQDNGPGISGEHLPRIFERFYRVDPSREGLRGTGLGLSIVKQIISKHKGKIWAESEGRGKGTTFQIELPLHS
jgi:two-component system phosphate regulon sensor histidine kinase PhoR